MGLGQVERKGRGHLLGRLGKGTSIDGGPKVQRIAGGFATGSEALKHVLVEVHAEGTPAGIVWVVQWTGPATLSARAVKLLQMSQMDQHLFDADQTTNAADVHTAARRLDR